MKKIQSLQKIWENESESSLDFYSPSKLKTILQKGTHIAITYSTKPRKTEFYTEIGFNRLDIISSLKKRYKKETYVLTVFKGKAATFDIFSKDLIIDERHEFHTVEEIIDYLHKKDYLKRKDWIK